jgi:anti-sigma regulatory factor (Ser/Thr protein kinase)
MGLGKMRLQGEGEAMVVRFALDLPNDAQSVPLCRRAVRVILEQLNIPRDRRYEIELALGEAATNVVRHAYPHAGNQYRVELEIGDETVRLTVLDQGQGFVRDSVPDPEDEQLGGRGVLLIERIADTAWFECVKGQGTRLVAEFTVKPQENGAAPQPTWEPQPPPERPWPA